MKEVIDTQTLILLYLDSLKSKTGCWESAGIMAIAKTCLADRATVRRNLKGDGKRHLYKKSLVGRGLVIEVEKGARTEYMITEKGHEEIGGIKSDMKRAVGELA
ncbi:archaellum operon transcriptional activator EarA family protein [Methanocella sp. MCL-LM]|uniref:archaellum operon transcriptional activator EarA family protein n=1 Tax=Methanocella sp. MCL-LM TaxID=3412035 RepID=UPI003C72E37A